MKAEYSENTEKKYEDKARELSGYDDAALLREAAAAEREWQQEKESHPERAAEIESMDELNYEILMSKLNSKGLKPISERRYNRKQKLDNRDVTKVRKINRKVVVLAAAVIVLVIGGSIGTAAKSGYRYSLYPEEADKNGLLRYNTSVIILNDKIEEAYKSIEEEIGIPVMILGYMPDEMRFNKVTLNEMGAIIEMKYGENSFFLRESKPLDSVKADLLASDRKPQQKIQNFWLHKELSIEENKLKNGKTEYSVSIVTEEGCYYFSGIIEKEQFVMIAENLMYKKDY